MSLEINPQYPDDSSVRTENLRIYRLTDETVRGVHIGKEHDYFELTCKGEPRNIRVPGNKLTYTGEEFVEAFSVISITYNNMPEIPSVFYLNPLLKEEPPLTLTPPFFAVSSYILPFDVHRAIFKGHNLPSLVTDGKDGIYSITNNYYFDSLGLAFKSEDIGKFNDDGTFEETLEQNTLFEPDVPSVVLPYPEDELITYSPLVRGDYELLSATMIKIRNGDYKFLRVNTNPDD